MIDTLPARPPDPSATLPEGDACAPVSATPDGERNTGWSRIRPWAAAVAMLLLFAAALVVLRRELAGTGYQRIMASVAAVPTRQVIEALGATALAYLMLAGYDLLALRYIGARIAPWRVLASSSLSYGISQTLGFPLLTGNAVRVRFWTAWGLSTEDMARAAAFVSATFTVGIVTVCAGALLVEPEDMLSVLHLQWMAARVAGAALLLVPMAWLAWSWRGSPLRIAGWEFAVPAPRLAVSQAVVAVLDWAAAGLVLWVLLPAAPALSFLSFLAAFVLAQTMGVVSHVPGGLGVVESVMVLALQPFLPAQETLAAMLAYRAIYYLVPFVASAVALMALEVTRQRMRVKAVLGGTQSALAEVSQWMRVLQPLLPLAIGASTFLGGVLLLLSGATPAVHGRVRTLTGLLPLGLIEFSHFVASVVGAGLLVLGWALRRRLDAAWGLTVGLLTIGIVASLLKGLDYEEAMALTVVLLVLLPSRRAFYRKAALTSEPLSAGWVTAIIAVVGASIWVGLFAYRHVDFSTELWWSFAVRGNAPRFLRATAGAVAVVLTLALARLLRQATYVPAPPTAAELARATVVVRASPASTPSLALLGDKSLLWNEAGSAFVMYGVAGRSWIAMGDPVGPVDAGVDAAWRFKSEADAHGAIPVFYQVGAERLPLYIDLGLTLLKLGEEALVPLQTFSLGGADHRWMRRNLNDAERAGMHFEVVPASAVPALLPQLRAISDEWLGTKATREKGFSLGRYDEAYLSHFPMALVHAPRDGVDEIVAFANLWAGAPGGEISPDLMRKSSHAPRGVMDFLFIQLLLWGKAQGYSMGNIGMAPLAGLRSPALSRPELAPLWSRAGAFLYGRGEQFYNFRGLRAFKSKFSPVWMPRYLASPGGFALPRVLANVTTLISGGASGIVHK